MAVKRPESYDLCVLGCGAGGFAAAIKAVDLGKRVCVVENGQIGGAAVMWGALCSKTFWELAKDYAIASKKNRGYRARELGVSFSAIRNTVIRAVREKQDQMRRQVVAFSGRHRRGKGSITFKTGKGVFITPERIKVVYGKNRTEEIVAENVLIATGSSPRQLPGIRVDQKRILDTDGILRLKKFPSRLMIVGAGISGCEFATIFSNFGQTKVFLIDHMARILPYEDADISRYVSRNLEDRGVVIHHSARLRTVSEKPEHLVVTLDIRGKPAKRIKVDTLLLSVGRSPNLSGLKLEHLPLKTDADGDLKTDLHCRIHDHLYAAGDVTTHPDLVSVAEMEGRYAVKHMFGVKQPPLSYRNMSTVMFFYPAVAAVGYNEKTCRKMKIPYRVATYSNALLSRAIAMRALSGFVKIIVSDDGKDSVLGMRAAGPQVSNTIMSISVLMELDPNIQNMLRLVYPHPTMSEGVQECLRLLRGESVYKPEVFPELIRIRSWHPDSGFRKS